MQLDGEMGHSLLMAIRFRITTIKSTGGDVVTFPESGVTCVVGGNNAGKSQFLSEIWRLVDQPVRDQEPLTIADMRVLRPGGTVEETEDWLRSHAISYDTAPGTAARYAVRAGDSGQTAAEIHEWFDSTHQGGAYLGNASQFFVHHATAGTLAGYAAGAVDSRSYNSANAPLGKLFRSGELETALSNAAFETFRERLVLDRVDVEIRLRVGEVSAAVPPINRPTKEYSDAVAALPLLDAQGDGLKSFAGLALHLLAERPNVLLVDEPEAFLHPGQARAVGRWLADQAVANDVQLIIATHDRDIVLGLLQAQTAAPVNVLRVSRDGSQTHLSQLQPDEVRAVWNSPVLRYSNVLQGLFHRKVVICESDGDCRFFGAALDELAFAEGKRALADDVLFVPAGSKNRIGTIAGSLAHLKVAAEAIVDFDALRYRADLKGIVAGLGRTWSPTMESNHRVFNKAPNDEAVWRILKNSGLNSVTPGAPYTACVALLRELAEVGVRVIGVGELEDFNKNINLHGAGWVSEALDQDTHKSLAVQELVRGVLD